MSKSAFKAVLFLYVMMMAVVFVHSRQRHQDRWSFLSELSMPARFTQPIPSSDSYRSFHGPRRRNELGGTLRPAGRRQQTLHQPREDLALRPLHLPHHHPGPGRRERLGRRAVRLHVQHAAARLQERVLRPLLPRVAHPHVVPAAHLRLHAGPARRHARRVQEARRQEDHSGLQPHRKLRPGDPEKKASAHHGPSLVDLHLQPVLPPHL